MLTRESLSQCYEKSKKELGRNSSFSSLNFIIGNSQQQSAMRNYSSRKSASHSSKKNYQEQLSNDLYHLMIGARDVILLDYLVVRDSDKEYHESFNEFSKRMASNTLDVYNDNQHDMSS